MERRDNKGALGNFVGWWIVNKLGSGDVSQVINMLKSIDLHS